MDDVGRLKCEDGALADRKAQLIRGLEGRHALGGGIANAPPELLARHRDRPSLGRGPRKPGPDGRHEPDRIGEQRQQHDDGKGHPAPGDQSAGGLLAPRRVPLPCGVKEEADDGEPDKGAADDHDEEERVDGRGLVTGRIQRRLNAGTAAQRDQQERQGAWANDGAPWEVP